MSRSKPCCVVNCLSYEKPLHRFPKDARVKDWIAATGNQALLNIAPQSLSNRYICHKHFEAKYVTTKNLLTRSAVPTLHLPEGTAILLWSIVCYLLNVIMF